MTEEDKYVCVGLGEILWDMLPTGKQLGGAPANFAYHAQALGAQGVVVIFGQRPAQAKEPRLGKVSGINQ